jgi:uncharacterized membrane protein
VKRYIGSFEKDTSRGWSEQRNLKSQEYCKADHRNSATKCIKKVRIPTMWGFGLGLLFLLPLLFLGHFFWIILLVLLFVSLFRLFAFGGRRSRAYPYYYGRHYWNYPDWYGYGRRPAQPGQPAPTALEILQQRYARGEIDATTYEQMRERLEGSSEPTQN